jgi:hypothetical protein
VAANVRQLDKTIDLPQQVVGRNVPLKRELVEQRRLINLPRTHHRFASPVHRDEVNQRLPKASRGEFFNTIRQNLPIRIWPKASASSAREPSFHRQTRS